MPLRSIGTPAVAEAHRSEPVLQGLILQSLLLPQPPIMREALILLAVAGLPLAAAPR